MLKCLVLSFGKVVSKLKETAQILYVIYLSMFAILMVILMVAGMPALIVLLLPWAVLVLVDVGFTMIQLPITTVH